jgi:hypothetical protein
VAKDSKSRAERTVAERRPALSEARRPPATVTESVDAVASLQQTVGNQAVLRGLAGERMAAGGPPPSSTLGGERSVSSAADVLLSDSASEVGPGQMRKTEFLAALETSVTRTAEEGLAPSGRTSRDCPHIRYWFAYYRRHDAAHLQRAVSRYAPETRFAANADDYVQLISGRVRRAVDRWAETGEVTAVPEPGTVASALLRLYAQLGPGRPLDQQTRRRMESIFGHDLSGVRVHTSDRAAGLSRTLRAEAVTMGKEIAFAPGRYRPGTPVGDALIAHELAHVVQQRAGDNDPTSVPPEHRDSALEREATNSMLGAVLALWSPTQRQPIRRRVRPDVRSGLRLQRCSYEVAHPPHVFKSCGFGASVASGLNIADLPTAPAPGRILVASQTYTASGDAKITGGTDDQARDWEAGFVQTLLSTSRRGDYLKADGTHHQYFTVNVATPIRDGVDASNPPFYHAPFVKTFTKTNSSLTTRMEDTPSTEFPWATPDGAGVLRTTDGKDEFASWMIVRQKSTGDIVFLNWANWEVDWSARFSPVARTGAASGSGSQVTGSGTGQGSHAPVLGGPIPNATATVSFTP